MVERNHSNCLNKEVMMGTQGWGVGDGGGGDIESAFT